MSHCPFLGFVLSHSNTFPVRGHRTTPSASLAFSQPARPARPHTADAASDLRMACLGRWRRAQHFRAAVEKGRSFSSRALTGTSSCSADRARRCRKCRYQQRRYPDQCRQRPPSRPPRWERATGFLRSFAAATLLPSPPHHRCCPPPPEVPTAPSLAAVHQRHPRLDTGSVMPSTCPWPISASWPYQGDT